MADVSRGTVLFVQEADDHRAHVEALRGGGYVVHIAASALAALEARDTVRLDAVIVPLLMPDATGTALARRFQMSHASGTPAVLILTPDITAPTAREDPMTTGATLCAVPCTPEALLAAVEKLLGVRVRH